MTLDQLVSLSFTLLMTTFGLMVIKLYWNLGHPSFIQFGKSRRPEHWFAHGIVIAFVSTTLNALYFKVWDRMAIWGWIEMPPQYISNIINVVLVSLMLWAAFCHLYAAYLNLPKQDKKEWSWLTVAFYPRQHLVIRWLNNRKGKSND